MRLEDCTPAWASGGVDCTQHVLLESVYLGTYLRSAIGMDIHDSLDTSTTPC